MSEKPQTSVGKDSGGLTKQTLFRFCPKCEQYAKLVSTETDAIRDKLFIQEIWDCLACGTVRTTYWFIKQGHS